MAAANVTVPETPFEKIDRRFERAMENIVDALIKAGDKAVEERDVESATAAYVPAVNSSQLLHAQATARLTHTIEEEKSTELERRTGIDVDDDPPDEEAGGDDPLDQL